jgi:hypothetical protein
VLGPCTGDLEIKEAGGTTRLEFALSSYPRGLRECPRTIVEFVPAALSRPYRYRLGGSLRALSPDPWGDRSFQQHSTAVSHDGPFNQLTWRQQRWRRTKELEVRGKTLQQMEDHLRAKLPTNRPQSESLSGYDSGNGRQEENDGDRNGRSKLVCTLAYVAPAVSISISRSRKIEATADTWPSRK